MPCNKSGCKLVFHVTCAQSAGLLCEEAGNYYDNVKYVGYCKHHYSKLKKSNSVKPIAPYRPQNQSENSSSDITPEKPPFLNTDLDLQQTKPKRKLTIINNLDDKITNDKKIKDSTTQNISSEDQKKSGLHVVTTNPSGNLVISIGAKVENNPSTSKKQSFEESETEKKQATKYQKTKNAMNITKTEDDQLSNGIKITEETNLYRIENKNTIIKPSGSTVNLPNMLETNTLKKETTVISGPSSHNKQVPKTEGPDKKVTNVPQMLGNTLNPTSSVAQKMANNLNEETATNRMYTNSEPNSSTNAQKHVLHRRNQKPRQSHMETTHSQGSAWPSFSNGINNNNSNNNNNNNTHALEDLLERQWEQGGAFLMEQAQHFDIASLLTCLYQLKSENVNLEDELASYTRRRDHLLAVNARLAIPLAPQNNRNQTPAPTTNNHTDAHIPTRPPRSNYQPNHGNIDPSLQHRYQNHSMANRHLSHQMSNNIPAQVVIRGGIQEPRPDSRRQVNQNIGVLNPNPMFQSTTQPANMTLPRHQMDGQPKRS